MVKTRWCAIVLLNVFLSIFGLARVDAWEIPTGVTSSDVVVGYLLDESSVSGEDVLSALILSAQQVTVADLDSSGNFTIPDGKVFLAGTRLKDILVSGITEITSLQADQGLSEADAVAAAIPQIVQLVQEQKHPGATYGTDALLYADFTTAAQLALEARPDDGFLIAVMMPSGPVLVSQNDLDQYVQNAVSSGGIQFGLQPDDAGLAEVLATVPTTYDPTAPANTAPAADAGPDQASVASAANVTLDGTGSSDPDAGDTLTYAWTQTAGTTVTLSDATAGQPTFTAPTLGANDAA